MELSQIVFILFTVITFYYAIEQYGKIKRNIFLGKDYHPSDRPLERWKNLLLIAFGQKKMFKRPVAAIMHLFIYVAFLFTQIEFIEIMIDGFFGVHRFFAPYLGGLYTLILGTIEVLTVLAFIGTVVFLVRRNILKVDRLHKPEMKGWPTADANIILILEILLIIGIIHMNGADVMLQQIDPEHYHATGYLPMSSTFAPILFDGLGKDMLVLIERFGWWLHLGVVYFFINYLPRSKHLHIFLAFPNVYFSDLKPRGAMENMPEVMNEVKSMLGLTTDTGEMSAELPEFGAKDVTDLSWKNLLDAYSCTECGRCTSVCPANLTGKKLSPRKIMMDIRDRADEIGNNLDQGYIKFKKQPNDKLTVGNYNDGKSLFDSITREEIHACTTCNACVEACPIMINPLDPILKMRRYEILTESAGPGDWLPMFNSLENSGSVWQIPDARDKWAQDMAEESN